MMPWELRKARPHDIGSHHPEASARESTARCFFRPHLVSVNELPDFAAPINEAATCKLVIQVCGEVLCCLPTVPTNIRIGQLMRLLDLAAPWSSSHGVLCWKHLPLLRPERTLAAYGLPATAALHLEPRRPDSYPIRLVWQILDFTMHVLAQWPIEKVRKAAAFQLGVVPLQVTLHCSIGQLFGKQQCSDIPTSDWLHIRLTPRSTLSLALLCDIRACARYATTTCSFCNRLLCRRHASNCECCTLALCDGCQPYHSCLNLLPIVYE